MGRTIAAPRSILFQIGGLVLAAIAAVLMIGFGVVMMTPAPPAARLLMPEVRAALLDPKKAAQFGFKRAVSDQAPVSTGTREGGLFAMMLASSLNVPLDRVRFSARSTDSRSFSFQQHASPITRLKIEGPFPKTGQQGIVLFRSRSGQAPLATSANLPSRRLFTQILFARPFAISDYQAALRMSDGRWVSVEPVKPWLSLWQKQLLIALALSTLVMAPLAWLAARRLTRPIRELASFASRADLGGEAAPPPSAAPREIAAASNAISDMRSRIQEEAASRSRMLAAVAHDMRTPLTGLRLRAETAPPEERERMAEDIARMEKMIGQVIAYSSGEQLEEPREPFDLDALVEECVRDARAQGQEAVFSPGPEVEVSAGPLSLRRAVRNLLDNAHRYGGPCEVRVAADGECASVLVEDRGPGIPDHLLDKVQEPFFRGEKSRNRDTGGTGLGLAISSSVARQHGGRLMLENREGGGLRTELRIRR